MIIIIQYINNYIYYIQYINHTFIQSKTTQLDRKSIDIKYEYIISIQFYATESEYVFHAFFGHSFPSAKCHFQLIIFSGQNFGASQYFRINIINYWAIVSNANFNFPHLDKTKHSFI